MILQIARSCYCVDRKTIESKNQCQCQKNAKRKEHSAKGFTLLFALGSLRSCSSGLAGLARPIYDLSRPRACVLSAFDYNGTVHQHIINSFWVLFWIVIGRGVR